MAQWGQLSFQDAASPLMEQLVIFHDHTMMLLTLTVTLTMLGALSLITNAFLTRYMLEGQEIETIWTLLPAMILMFLALPSLRLLYLLDEVGFCMLTIKSIGHQWYWSYEYSDFLHIEFDSYMTPTNELEVGQYRLLEVDNRAVLPIDSDIRVLVTSSDVIHSWAVPTLGVKVDAVPGRLNQLNFSIKYPGIFYGQCSEICGANHSFMPIVLETVEVDNFSKWLASATNNK